ncbi:MAG: hypothetical protein ACI4T2_00630 [Christensenellales bacterium]
MQEFRIGDLVVSTAGHDMGAFYVVVDVIDKNYVALADGKNKPITSPKKKKIKHILSLGQHEVDFELKISQKDVDSNAYIKKILKKFENS